MKILVTGGTGFIGQQIVDILIQNNHSVTVITRNKDNCKNKSCNIIEGDLLDKDFVFKALVNQDIIYHLACIKEEKYSYKDLYKANVETTKNVLDACVQNKIKQFIFTSTIGVLGETNRIGIKEDAPYNPQTPYEKTKMEAEKLVLKYQKEHNLPITIIRPTMVYGIEDVWLKVFSKAKKGIPVFGSGKNYWHLVYVKDVVDVLVSCLDNKNAFGEIFNIADAEPMMYIDVYKIFRETLRQPVVTKHIPIWLINFIAMMNELLSKITGKNPIISKSHIKRLTRQRNIDISKAKALLGYKPKYNNKTGFAETIALFQKQGLLL